MSNSYKPTLILLTFFVFLSSFLVTQAQTEPRPVDGDSCTTAPAGMPWCAAFNRMSGTFERFYVEESACLDFCSGTTCIPITNRCVEVTEFEAPTDPDDDTVTPTGEYCRATAEPMCDECYVGNCTQARCEQDIEQPDGNCRFYNTIDPDLGLGVDEGYCVPDPAQQCGGYCYLEVDLMNSAKCFNNRAACVAGLQAQNPEPGDLALPACGCDANTISTPVAQGGCGFNAGDWNSGIGQNSMFSLTGQGLDASFTLDGFKPFENVRGLYVQDGQTSTIPQFINTFLGFAIGISGAAVVVIIVVGGFRYVIAAAGNSKKDAKKDIFEAIVGLIILLAAVAILNTINPRLLNLDQLEPITVTITKEELRDNTTGYNVNVGTTGVGGTNPSAGSVGAWQVQMEDAARRNGLSYCMVEALVSTESNGNELIASNIIFGGGCPANACDPINPINTSAPDTPRRGHYGMTFSGGTTRGSIAHAIGLTQITIYGPNYWGSSDIPARPERDLEYGGSRSLTIATLIDPVINLDVGTKYFQWILENKTDNDPVRAYNGYNRGPGNMSGPLSSQAEKYGNFYRACIARQ